MNPYQTAIAWMEAHRFSGAAEGLAKLILSLWNINQAFGVGECIKAFDGERKKWALDMINYFMVHGEDRALIDAGNCVRDLYPQLWELGKAGFGGKYDLRQQWDQEDRERADAD